MVKRYKKDSEVSYALGITLTIELLRKKLEHVTNVYVHSKIIKGEGFLIVEEICKNNNIPLIYNDKVFNILSKKENDFIIGEFIKYDCMVRDNSNHVVLVNPSNGGNLGTIMRSMVGFEFTDLVIITPAVDHYDPSTIRSSMGSIFNLNISLFSSFDEYKETYKNRVNYPLMLQASRNINSVDVAEPYSLIFGNEATGLSESYLSEGESLIINHSNLIDSLNLPIAVSITLYEVSKNKFK